MNNGKKIKLNKHLVRRIIIAIFCAVIGICVAYVMFNLYDPNQNSVNALSSTCMDVVCIIILITLIFGFVFGKYGLNRTTRIYAGLLVASIWAIFLDFLNWAFDGSLVFWHLTYWFTVGSLCMGSILACILCIYLYSYMNEIHHISGIKKRAYICALLNLGSFVLTFVLALTGTAFIFVDGHYKTGALYDVVTAIPVLILLYLSSYIIRNVKKIGIYDVVAVVGYIFLMIAGALIEAEYSIGTTYVAVAIADIFIFAMLQNEIIAREKRNVQEWKTKSTTDELTGFNNRHAYEADIKTLKDSVLEDDFVYVSVDVNSLKVVNDSLGHLAGDEILIGAAECLKKCFSPYGKLYRIGGDEFVALIFIDEEHLSIVQNNIIELTNNWKGEFIDTLSISCGYVARKEDKELTIEQIATLADKRMYEAKNEYYRKTGIDRRKY